MRDIRKRRIIILILAAASMLLATGVYVVTPTGVSAIEILTDEGERLEESYDVFIGESVQLRCRVSPKPFAHREVEYYAADSSILTVDEGGVISGIKEGQTLLTVKCAGVRKTVVIDVEPSVREIKGLKDVITLYVDDEYQLEPVIVMAEEDLDSAAVTYKAKRTTIAKVDKKGMVTGVGAGTTKITVKAGTLSETVKVRVEERPIEAGPAVIYTDNGSKKTVRDSSDNTSSDKKEKKSNSKNKKKEKRKKSSNSSDKNGDSGGDQNSGGNETGTDDSGISGEDVDTGDNGSGSGDSGNNTDDTGVIDGGTDSGDSGSGTSSGNNDSVEDNSGSGSSGPGSSETDINDSSKESSSAGTSDSGSGSNADPNSQTDADLTAD